MSNLTIRTNRVPRPLLSWWELTPKEQSELDYVNDNSACDRFFRYKGNIYDTHEFTAVRLDLKPPMDGGLKGWDAYASDSFFSGTVLKFQGSGADHVVVGTYFS